MRASVIIPTYQRPVSLADALESVRIQNFPAEEYEILIVDNAPDTTQQVSLLCDISKKPSMRYIHEPHNGLHNARHAGARAAKGEILVYVDDDVKCDGNFLTEILRPYSDPQVGCAGGKILPKFEGELPEWLNMFPKWYLSILDDNNGPKEVQYIYGCNFSIRRSLLFELGGFNPDGFGDKKLQWMRGDGEIGLLRKVHATGKKAIYNPAAVLWHFIPKERLSIEYFQERAFKNGIEASFSKHRYSNNSLTPVKLLLRAAVFGMYCIFHNVLSFIPNQSNIKH
ncbi:MAG: glycosyltransferase, partial [Dehalococcoidia bacterium]|nr:glycosyltransferase [Dehalococcoidia bacterium]